MPLNSESKSLWIAIGKEISVASRKLFEISRAQSVSGGCINDAYFVQNNQGERYFVKTNQAEKLTMFEAEVAGLIEIARTHTVRVPQPICSGKFENTAFVVTEYIEMVAGNASSHRKMGTKIANMHMVTQAEFGWRIDNTIGDTPQPNGLMNNWIDFWREHRLGFQLNLALKNSIAKEVVRKGEKLMVDLAAFFPEEMPRPALLYGDLWGGNWMMDSQGEPVVFDPAVYYGDREADIAMTELFGGFSPDFYAAYNAVFPLDAGYKTRKTLYNLYHVLNHFNLFSGGYAAQAERMIDTLLAEIH
ncbi:fructosamine kinase family protein [Sulfurirhabdus autotrophica]|uniref:Fructosamine-3-kinase n=1 Tax=Sulfurirhabdus autotrophica TaxID=1706046 RepID=A0A4R3XXY2_9PROT|nr:fructosamine kinase family protein [Sulfurirhabdus autotrophica]TCV84166.1 fructosamine-3-kinase [Sulfurirhabdus autotrophica]